MALTNALEARTVNTARSPAIIYPGNPVSASGQGVLALTVSPAAAGNLLMLVFGFGGAGKVSALSSAVSGGGVTQWKRTAGRLDTADHQLVEVWSGVVTTPGQSAVTVHCPTAAAEWNRFWALEALSIRGCARVAGDCRRPRGHGRQPVRDRQRRHLPAGAWAGPVPGRGD